MKFKEYEEFVSSTAFYPATGEMQGLVYAALGLSGEAGEYSEKIKKYLRDGKLDKSLAVKELGDVLWYVTRSANELGYSIQDVAEINIVKLTDRKDRGVLSGNGDER